MKVYRMKNFIVGVNNLKIRTTEHRFKLTFYVRTVVDVVISPDFPLRPYIFRGIEKLNNVPAISEVALFDVVGEIVGKEEPKHIKTNDGKDTQRIIPYIEKTTHDPLIVVLQLSKGRKYLEVLGIKESLKCLLENSSQRISQLSSDVANNPTEKIIGGLIPVKNFEEVLTAVDDCVCWFLGTIVALDIGEKDWCYNACTKCPKKVDGHGTRFICGKCGRVEFRPQKKYRLQLIVSDASGSMTITMWDKESRELIGKTAEELKKESIGDNDVYPIVLDTLIERTLLFKINVVANNYQLDNVYSVASISLDPNLIDRVASQSFKIVNALDYVPHTDNSVSAEQVNSIGKDTHDVVDESKSPSSLKTLAKRMEIEGLKKFKLRVMVMPKESYQPQSPEEIFLRVDVKAVGRSQCVSKEWCGMLGSSFFLKLHHDKNKYEEGNVLMQIGYEKHILRRDWITAIKFKSREEVQFNLPHPIDNHGWFNLLSSENGTLCFNFSTNGDDSRVLIWNPIRRRTIILPQPIHEVNDFDLIVYAFGYLPNSFIYRVIQVFKNRCKDKTFMWKTFYPERNQWGMAYPLMDSISALDTNATVLWLLNIIV
ncbi:hypothetical protein PIB30_011522 [Stylosanthes scabra]|uniref:Replication factor A C-terminal domain-containing protein n=1 Tax=Stylosanthes scabra TaxID=79078 RepID=A0ABU6T7V5_9FABA|nr:hypothetical protein [Stylosanthes scabra]